MRSIHFGSEYRLRCLLSVALVRCHLLVCVAPHERGKGESEAGHTKGCFVNTAACGSLSTPLAGQYRIFH